MANEYKYTISSRLDTLSITTITWSVKENFQSIVDYSYVIETSQYNIHSIPNSNFYMKLWASKKTLNSSDNYIYCNIELVFVNKFKLKGTLCISLCISGREKIKVITGKLSDNYTAEYSFHFKDISSKYPDIKCTIYHELWKEDKQVPVEQSSLKTKTETMESNTLINDLELLYNNNLFSDFTISVKDYVYRVHKNILAARSPVFNKMLTNNMKEQQDNYVYLTGVNPESFEIALYFMYTGKIKTEVLEDEEQLLSDTYIFADRYQCNELKSICEDILKNIVTTENVIAILNLAHMTDNYDLKKISIDFINDNKDAVQTTEDFKTLQISKSDVFIELISFLAGIKIQ